MRQRSRTSKSRAISDVATVPIRDRQIESIDGSRGAGPGNAIATIDGILCDLGSISDTTSGRRRPNSGNSMAVASREGREHGARGTGLESPCIQTFGDRHSRGRTGSYHVVPLRPRLLSSPSSSSARRTADASSGSRPQTDATSPRVTCSLAFANCNTRRRRSPSAREYGVGSGCVSTPSFGVSNKS